MTKPIRALIDGKLQGMGLAPFPPIAHSPIGCSILLSDAYLPPTVQAFEYDYGKLPRHVHFVGALPPFTRGVSLPDWWADLDSGKPAVLVTQGTMANKDFGELITRALEALADRDDLLVVVTTGGRPVGDVPGPIPNNVRLAEYLDYGQLLPKLSGLVTNGGYGTVQLALRAGVPIVTAGRTEDRPEIGARIAWSGVGLDVSAEHPSASELRESIAKLLSEPSYRARARHVAAEMATINTETEVLGIFNDLVRRSNAALTQQRC